MEGVWAETVMVIIRCDLEGQSEGGVSLEALEKASEELGFDDFLRFDCIDCFVWISFPTLQCNAFALVREDLPLKRIITFGHCPN